jgi:hypothetical protein
MSPAWALPTSGGAFPQRLRPPAVGLVQWAKGDADLVPGAATRIASWLDQSPLGQDWVQDQVGDRPYDLGDQIDGIPCLSFGVAGDANKFFTTASNFTDRLGAPMDGAAARTVMVMIKPRFDADWGITGGNVWVQSSWNALFELRSNAIPAVPDGAYGWMRAAGDYANALQFTPVVGGALGPYSGAPTLLQWSSPGFPSLEFRINNVPTTLTPAAMYSTPGGVGPAQLSINFIALLGSVSEQLVWDYDLTSDANAQAAAVDYMKTRYPSAPVVS